MIDYAQIIFNSISAYEWIAFAVGAILIFFCDRMYNMAMRLIKKEKQCRISVYAKLLCIYVLFILLVTLFSRASGHRYEHELVPLWSWREAIDGNSKEMFEQIVLNIVLFVPLGILLKICFKDISLIKIFLLGFALSAAVEISQLVFHLGLFEWDDMLHNSLGCLLGGYIMKVLCQIRIHWKQTPGKF